MSNSGIRDNYIRGKVGDFLRQKIQPDSTLSVVSAYFTIYAFEALKEQLSGINGLRFLFGEPRFVKSLDPEKTDKKAFKIEDDGLQLANRLEQKRVAKECAEWIADKVQIRSIKQANLLHGKMYHIAHDGVEDAILGSSNFTIHGLGLSSTNNNIELNLEVDSNRDRRDLKAWFDELWNNTDLLADVEDEELREALEVGKGLVYKMAHLDLDRWLRDLERDRIQLEWLSKEAHKVTAERDAKLAELKKLIAHKITNPTTNTLGKPNRKVLVFAAFADTAYYLYNTLHDWVRQELGIHMALVSGGAIECKTTFGKADFNHILINFSPVAKNRNKMKSLSQEGEIDLLIATDCISEGQNLQDCDYLINYDIHWNPVRIIQRFGRIDRIGSINTVVQLVNFWPTQDLNKYINLKNRVEARMALVDIAATQEDNILNMDELQELITDDLKYRDKQLLRLKDEILDLEDFSESVALSEFTLDDFRIELMKYIEANRTQLEQSPLGLYAVAPTHPEYPQIAAGVIFCLKQLGDTSGNETVNPLQPYFLVYVRDDGIVRYTFAQPKQILEIYRLLCTEKSTPHEALCDLFDQETKNGADMTRYSELLQKAVESIVHTFKKRALTSLLSGRGGVLVEASKQVTSTSDFQLITWLVIKNPGKSPLP